MFATLVSKFAFANLKVPAIDITRYLAKGPGWENDCKEVADTLKTYGLVIIKDPRVSQQNNDNFLNLMERYFVKRSQQYHAGNKTVDFSP
jgi:isopenicillin N synthase-like dioxygenase